MNTEENQSSLDIAAHLASIQNDHCYGKILSIQQLSLEDNTNETVVIAKPNESVECNICDKQFSQPSRLEHHMKTVHSKNHHICQICSRMFQTTRDLSRHIREVHKQAFFSCQFCSFSCARGESYNKHMATHALCPICEGTFADNVRLKKHIAETHTCKTCGHLYASVSELYEHMSDHNIN